MTETAIDLLFKIISGLHPKPNATEFREIFTDAVSEALGSRLFPGAEFEPIEEPKD